MNGPSVRARPPRRLAAAILAVAAGALWLLVLTEIALAASATVRAAKTGPGTYSFQPRTLIIVVGTRVTWTNPTDAPHSVTADGGAFDSGYLYPGDTYARTFNAIGTFAYHCTIHPGQLGAIVVRAASAAGAGAGQPDTATERRGAAPPGELLLVVAAAGAAAAWRRSRLVWRRDRRGGRP